jgi:hypothetical protein
VAAFAQDGDRAAWLGGRCSEVHEGVVGEPASTVLGDADPQECPGGPAPLLALAGRRALWTTTMRGPTTFVDVTSGAPGEAEILVEELASDTLTGEGDHVAALAGDGRNLVYAVNSFATPETCASAQPCALALVDGRSMLVSPGLKVRLLPTIPPATRIALAGDAIAEVPALQGPSPGAVARPAHGFEVHSIRTGKLLAQVPVAQPIEGLALTPAAAVVLTRGADGAARIARYAIPGGRLVGTTRVASSAGDLGASPRGVVYRTGRTIRLLGRARPLATAAATPVGLSIDGARVAWAENVAGHGRIRSVRVR